MTARKKKNGQLIIIGGHEDKTGDRLILQAVAKETGRRALVVVTAASNQPEDTWREYRSIFRELGVATVRHLHVDVRAEAMSEKTHGVLDGAGAVFFAGGDQLKLTSQLGDTPVYQKTKAIYETGGLIAGTSAGASVVCETMLVSGTSDGSPRIRDALRMAPGFGFISGVIIDQHFAERGRLSRLIGAVAQNPRILGIGIDENTAILCDNGYSFRVLGDGGVYVVDASNVTNSNVVEDAEDRTLSVFNIRLHLLNMGDEFDLKERVPSCHSTDEAEEKAGAAA